MKPTTALLAAALLACASCATMTGPGIGAPAQGKAPAALAGEAVPPGMGRVVFGRPSAFAGSAATFRFLIEGTVACEIGNGSYAVVLVQAGERALQFQNVAMGGTLWSQASLLPVPEGGTVYFEYRPKALTPAQMFLPSPTPLLDYSALSRVVPLAAAVNARGGAPAQAASRPASVPAQPVAPAAPPAKAAAPSPATASKAPAAAPAAQISFPKGRSSLSKNVIAVVIGNKDYERGTSPVLYALNDAASFRELLERSFGIATQDIWYGENLGLADMISLFGTAEGYRKSRIYRTASMRDSPTDLVLYYSGHGAPSTSGATKGKGFLLPVDADLLAIQSTGFPIETLLANVAGMKAEKVIGRAWLVFDACFSGQGGDGSSLVKNVSGLAVVQAAPKAAMPDAVLMFASSGEEYASWYPEQGHGLFTWFLLKGLSGEADANGDRNLSVAELDSYLRRQVPRFANGLNAQEQTPQVLYAGEPAGFLSLGK